MDPHAFEPAPVRVQVALPVAPETARHARPWIADRELADLSTHRAALGVEHVRGDAGHRARERAGPKTRDHIATQNAARDLRPTRVVDDGDPTAADVLEEPLERLGVPRLARAAQDAQARKIVVRRHLVAMGHQAADQGGGDAEHGHLVVGDHAPQTVRRRVIRRALVEDHGRAEDQRPEDEPGAHHPADVRVPEDRVVGADVKTVRHVLRRLDGEPAVHVQAALGLAGRA